MPIEHANDDSLVPAVESHEDKIVQSNQAQEEQEEEEEEQKNETIIEYDTLKLKKRKM